MCEDSVALQRYKEENNNFRALFRFKAIFNAIVADHLKNANHRTMHTSPKIYNKIIDNSGGFTHEEIVACNGTKYFGLMAYEATDAATIKQLAIFIRNYDAKT